MNKNTTEKFSCYLDLKLQTDVRTDIHHSTLYNRMNISKNYELEHCRKMHRQQKKLGHLSNLVRYFRYSIDVQGAGVNVGNPHLTPSNLTKKLIRLSPANL